MTLSLSFTAHLCTHTPTAMFSRFAQTTLRNARGYATAASPKAAPSASSSGVAPYFLGAGLAGSALFYYSTQDQRALRAEQQRKSSTPALSPDEFRNLTLAEVKPYNHNTSRFVFDLPDGTSSGLTVASALVVKAAKEGECLNDKGKPVIRPYTPVTAPDLEGKLELLIKHYPNGAFTEYLWKLQPGDAIAFKGLCSRLSLSSFESTHWRLTPSPSFPPIAGPIPKHPFVLALTLFPVGSPKLTPRAAGRPTSLNPSP